MFLLQAFKKFNVILVSSILIPIQAVWTSTLLVLGGKIVLSTQGQLSPIGMRVRFGGKKHSRTRLIAKKLFFDSVDRTLLRMVTAVHAQSQYEAELAMKYGAKKVFVLPAGIDASWYREPGKFDYPKSGKTCTFTYVGRLDLHHKGLDLVLSAVSRLHRNGVEGFHVVLAGSDLAGSLDDLRARVQQLEIGEIVSVNGPTWGEQKEELLNRTDYFLGIFRYAGMARACGEAVARGIPLLASREGNWGDWVERYSFGYAVALDPDHVYECINKAVNIDKQAYFEFSRNAYKWATDNSWEKVAEQFCEQYENIMN